MISMEQLQIGLNSCSLRPSSSIQTNSVFNLLLLGKSGVGKSTFINALHNYLTYSDIDDIEYLCQIPVPIAFEMRDDNNVNHEFKVGEEMNADDNENLTLNAGSGTRGCKAYKYYDDGITINIIDTPGLVDTDGIDKDKENMENILNFIGQYKTIHGICILLRPDEERLDDVFKYCIQELLGQLHCAAASNIIWIFTKAEASRYKVGSTGRAIRRMIEEIHERNPKLQIPFSETNYFLFDSSSFLYAVAKNKIKFNVNDINVFKSSWDVSRNEFKRMINYVIFCVTPYDVRMSLSIHRVRELIDNLLPHLQKITNNIIEMELQYQQKESEVINFEGEIEELKKMLFVEITELQTTHYDGPRFVCKSVHCRREIIEDGETLISYPQICCALSTSIKETLKNVPSTWENLSSDFRCRLLAYLQANLTTGLLFTAELPVALAGFCVASLTLGACWYLKGECSQCGCPNKEHSITYYEVHDVQVRKESPSTKNELLKKNNDISNIKKAFIKFIEEELQPIQQEMEVVSKASQMFVSFLKQTAIVAYSDAFPAYLKVLIKNAHGHEKAEKLKEHLKTYLERIDFFEKCSMNEANQKNIEPQQIDKLVEELKKLPIYGPGIETAIEAKKNIQTINDYPGWNQEFNAYEVHNLFF